ncbi:BadF/BadG/BcrA/BcrD ATPase family protein [Thalassospira australica]|uniref:BadF/BadG/BcrA/BcrD ATPase family protein n=1 Tax=Thalassospira australica TaxID=1528106 RepID=UPI00051A7CCF|nr:BadF/BadG/BcrA/BcrD ATPase family protein [Thalassospira australica]
MTDERLYLGVDGGGTRSRVRIATESGKVLGEAVRGGANTRLGMDHIFGEITAAAVQALIEAGLDESRIGDLHAGLGLAGLPLERERKLIEAYPHPFASICFATDAYTACLGAHNGENGAILIVGTGTCGQAIIDGKELSVAGWGFEISDIGSGGRIGRAAIEAALLAHDDLAEQTDLTRSVMAKFEHNPENIVTFAETARPAEYGAFCPMVFEAEANGDVVATSIINHAVAANLKILRKLVAFGAQRVSLMGGLSEQMTRRMPTDIQNLIVPAKFDAMHGAILMAKNHERNAT